jgi:hypothetical protein
MSNVNIKLGHEQKFRVDGVVMDGTRDVEVSIDTKQFDVTAWDHLWTSTLPVGVDVTVRALIYWPVNFGTIWSKFNRYPPIPVRVVVDGVIDGKFLPVEARIDNPLGQVLAYDVTFKLWDYA